MTENAAGYTALQLDEKAVRVLAHPLRSRILSELRLQGPATATTLAKALATNTGATSYHLRSLESVGLVTDTEEGLGKRREWRATTDSHSWTNSDFAGDEDTQTALAWLQRDYVRRLGTWAEHWLDAQDRWPSEWVDRLGLSDTLLTVTPEQAESLAGELDELLSRYRHAGQDDPRARRLLIAIHTSPVDPDTPPVSV